MRQVLCPVLVAREDETRQIEAALVGAGAGRGGTLLVTGEAGVGKSRLIREAARAASAAGFVVLTGRAVPSDVPTPFRPFAEALAAASRAGRLPASQDLDPFRPVLSRLVPAWRQPGQPAADDSLVFLGDAVLRLLRSLEPAAGCLLILEDLHWADRETLALLEFLADNLSSEPVLCLGTTRAEGGTPAAELAVALQARGSAAMLPLTRLSAADSARMARACVGAADLPPAVQSLVAHRAEGLPFLVEEVLAGLIGDGSLVERDGLWDADPVLADTVLADPVLADPVLADTVPADTVPADTGALSSTPVPATFADALRRRLSGLDLDSRRVISAAAVLGRRFDWGLLAGVTALPEDAIARALRQGVSLQIFAADTDSFRFRHALTHEAVLAGLLPPERARLAGQALAAIEMAHPGLPADWGRLAAELAAGAGDRERAGALLLEAGRRDLAVGALASAEHTLLRARSLTGRDDPARCGPVDEALTEVFALSGQVERAMETGRILLARLGGQADTGRAGQLHLDIARAAIAGARWADAAASIEVARGSAGVEPAQVDACAAHVALGRGRLAEADKLAGCALAAARASGRPDVACEALEVIGRVARQRDLDAAERAFAEAADVATAHGLQLWRARALHELGTIDQLRTESVDRLEQARELASGQGALALTATLDLQIAAGLNKQFRAGEALAAARRCEEASRRFRLATLPIALIFQATAHAIRGEQEAMEAAIASAIAAAPDDPDVLGCAWGHCRATYSLLADDLAGAHAQMTTGADFMLSSPATMAPPFLGTWVLLAAALGLDAESAAARVRAAQGTRHRVVGSQLGYAEAVLAGRRGAADDAGVLFAGADAQMGPLVAWYQHYARRICAQAALTDGWGEPVRWLREAAEYFADRGDDQVAAGCRNLLRESGAPVPRRRTGEQQVPGRLRALGVTEREAEVLRLAALGLGNREIAARMVLSPRTVEKHVEHVLAKTGVRRDQLATYLTDLDT